MTMQIAIEARSGFVLVSDRKIIRREDQGRSNLQPDTALFQSKVCISKPHDIAVALAGSPPLDADPLQEFTNHLSALKSIPEDFGKTIGEWGALYQQKHGEGWYFSLLVVNPHSLYEPFWKVTVSREVGRSPRAGYVVNGNETNVAIMWPEYCKCGGTPALDLETAVNAGALTILMGHKFSRGVENLEIWRYTDTWTRATPAEINAIGDRFVRLKSAIDSFINPPSATP